MENKFKHQQQKNTSNNNTKYLDHVYCHTNAHDNKSYMRANNNHHHHHNNNNNAASAGMPGGQDGPAMDMYALMKENKQLKTMLILHLDLIQEQSDQLVYKDKKLSTQAERLEALGQAKQQLEQQVQELQYQLQCQLKRANAVAAKELTSVSPPPLAKIQVNVETSAGCGQQQVQRKGGASKHIIGECNGKLISKIKLQRVEATEDSANSSCSSSDEGEGIELNKSEDTEGKRRDEEVVEDSEDENDEDDEQDESPGMQHEEERAEAKEKEAAAKATETLTNPLKSSLAAPVVQQICVTPPTPSRGKQMPIMLWHAPDMHSDESGSGESMGDAEHPDNPEETSPPAAPATEPNKDSSTGTTVESESRSSQGQPPLRRSRRLAYLTTTQLYCTREWQDNGLNSDGEQLKEEPKCSGASLEIPKWIEHELSPSYCIEGTEDLCDDTFLKRHAKLEVDEKRRKKWDVQQIREQRRIEKLKRRHCKEELQTAQDQQSTPSFYPQPEDITTIYYTSQLPVQAFGEMIPKLSTTSEFSLPWLRESDAQPLPPPPPQQPTHQSTVAITSGDSSAQVRVPVQNSSFIFLKKRRRRQSSTTAIMPTARQRTLAAAKALDNALKKDFQQTA